jgi:hypothetical protein
MPVAHLMRDMSADEFRLWLAYHDLVAAERDEAMKSRQSSSSTGATDRRAFGGR